MPFSLIYDFNFNYFSPVEEEQNQFGKGINSVGGWLMVIQVFIFLNAYGWIRNLQVFSALFGEKDNLIRSQGISNPALYNAFIYYELAASIIFISFFCCNGLLHVQALTHVPVTIYNLSDT